MENIKKLEEEADFNLLNKNIDNIINESVYHDGRDWTEDEINLFVKQFTDYQKTDEVDIDMNMLDPNFISLEDYKEKFNGFDDEVLQYMVECENKKLEDARIPPLIVRNETVTLTDSLSNVILNGEKGSQSKAECNTDSESSSRGFEETEEEEEEVSV
tara:strand:+ start:608 stop:1081 length:474 start_codon:yes stop_codon:yes gene_type:complete